METADLQAMVERGAGLIVATATADGEPRATRAWAVTLSCGGRRARAVVTADDPVAVAGLHRGRVALTAADVRTLRAVQLKGRVRAVEVPGAEDVEVMVEQTQTFFQAIHETDGNPLEQLQRMLPHEVVVIEVDVEEWFDQTPGPAAGATLTQRPAVP